MHDQESRDAFRIKAEKEEVKKAMKIERGDGISPIFRGILGGNGNENGKRGLEDKGASSSSSAKRSKPSAPSLKNQSQWLGGGGLLKRLLEKDIKREEAVLLGVMEYFVGTGYLQGGVGEGGSAGKEEGEGLEGG